MILFVHLGGLGDVCLSESLFLSLSHYFREVVAVGHKRYLELFDCYFSSVESIEERKWLYLFGLGDGPSYERIVLVGKDRSGEFRARLQRFSRLPLIFIDMYPDFPMHVEDYQLLRLSEYGIPSKKKEIPLRRANRVIIYPEIGLRKSKWPIENFVTVYKGLKERGIEVVFLLPVERDLSLPDSLFFQDLNDVKRFLEGGGIFLSNDCGLAHLASVCGLFSITIFLDQDKNVWHPRGSNLSLYGQDLKAQDVAEMVLRNYALMVGGEYDGDHLQACKGNISKKAEGPWTLRGR